MTHRLNPGSPRAAPKDGFALITTLWLVAALAALVGLGLATTRLGIETTLNRVLLARGRWAAEACLAIAQGRWAGRRMGDTATIDLGQERRCAWRVEDPTARMNVNAAEKAVLEQTLSAVTRQSSPVSHQPSATDSVLQAILERRRAGPIGDLAELELPDGFKELLTADGPGTINLNAAPAPVLAALPGMSAEAVERVLYRRSVGRPLESLDALAAELSPPGREALLARYADLARLVTVTAPQLVIVAEGWTEEGGGVGSDRLRARIEVLVVPLPDRLAVIRRRMQT